MSVRQVLLGAVCTQDRTSVRPGHGDELPYLGLEGIESGSGQFVESDLSKTPEVPQANSFRFDERHVLYGKLRPYLNKVALPTKPGKCSTEIIPLLPSSQCDRQYLSFFLRAPSTVQQITGRSAGARMPRADMDFVLSLPITLPALDGQRRIVDLLSRAEGIVRLRRQAQQKAAALIPAIFVDMFGDPATNPKGWSRMALGDLIASGPTNGLYKHKSAYGSGTPILRIDAFYDGRVTDLAALKRVQVEPDEQRRYALSAGDIIVNRVNSPEYLGKSALVPELLEPTVFESNMMRFSIDALHALPEFVIALLQNPSTRRHFLTNAKHAINQSSINQQDVKSLPVFAPPLKLQRQFAQRVAAVRAIEQQQQAATSKATATFSALLAKAFTAASPEVQHEAERALA
ncbi:MAG: restriction endonuclease subunit S [Burkholderiales bacterium]|nr:restriction endonuclease subunit S [Burkholderiales bacterium]